MVRRDCGLGGRSDWQIYWRKGRRAIGPLSSRVRSGKKVEVLYYVLIIHICLFLQAFRSANICVMGVLNYYF